MSVTVSLVGGPPWGLRVENNQELRPVVSKILPGGRAALAGVQIGDLIESINNQSISSAGQAHARIQETKQPLVLQLTRSRTLHPSTAQTSGERSQEDHNRFAPPKPPLPRTNPHFRPSPNRQNGLENGDQPTGAYFQEQVGTSHRSPITDRLLQRKIQMGVGPGVPSESTTGYDSVGGDYAAGSFSTGRSSTTSQHSSIGEEEEHTLCEDITESELAKSRKENPGLSRKNMEMGSILPEPQWKMKAESRNSSTAEGQIEVPTRRSVADLRSSITQKLEMKSPHGPPTTKTQPNQQNGGRSTPSWQSDSVKVFEGEGMPEKPYFGRVLDGPVPQNKFFQGVPPPSYSQCHSPAPSSCYSEPQSKPPLPPPVAQKTPRSENMTPIGENCHMNQQLYQNIPPNSAVSAGNTTGPPANQSSNYTADYINHNCFGANRARDSQKDVTQPENNGNGVSSEKPDPETVIEVTENGETASNFYHNLYSGGTDRTVRAIPNQNAFSTHENSRMSENTAQFDATVPGANSNGHHVPNTLTDPRFEMDTSFGDDPMISSCITAFDDDLTAPLDDFIRSQNNVNSRQNDTHPYDVNNSGSDVIFPRLDANTRQNDVNTSKNDVDSYSYDASSPHYNAGVRRSDVTSPNDVTFPRHDVTISRYDVTSRPHDVTNSRNDVTFPRQDVPTSLPSSMQQSLDSQMTRSNDTIVNSQSNSMNEYPSQQTTPPFGSSLNRRSSMDLETSELLKSKSPAPFNMYSSSNNNHYGTIRRSYTPVSAPAVSLDETPVVSPAAPKSFSFSNDSGYGSTPVQPKSDSRCFDSFSNASTAQNDANFDAFSLDSSRPERPESLASFSTFDDPTNRDLDFSHAPSNSAHSPGVSSHAPPSSAHNRISTNEREAEMSLWYRNMFKKLHKLDPNEDSVLSYQIRDHSPTPSTISRPQTPTLHASRAASRFECEVTPRRAKSVGRVVEPEKESSPSTLAGDIAELKRVSREEEMFRQKAERLTEELEQQRQRRHGYIPSASPALQKNFDRFEGLMNNYPQQKEATPTPANIIATATAVYKFVPKSSRELGLNKGDIVRINREIDSNWLEGERNGKTGIFPATYVQINNMTRDDELRMRAVYPFTARNDNEMNLTMGELVTFRREIDHNWIEGRNHIGEIGIFPKSYVREVENVQESPAVIPTRPKTPKIETSQPATDVNFDSSYRHQPSVHFAPQSQQSSFPQNGEYAEPVSNSAPKVREWQEKHNNSGLSGIANQIPKGSETYRVLFPYRPQKEDELELVVNDIVFVVEKCDDGWFIGTLLRTGAFGTFPGNYVQRH